MIPTLPVPTLSRGSHGSGSGKMCINEAVAFLAGETHSDRPECMCPAIASFTMAWNDSLPTDEERARLLGPLLEHVIDTRGSDALADRRSLMALDWLVRVQTPAWMSLNGSLRPHADALTALPELCDSRGVAAARPTISAAWAAAGDAARDAAGAAAGAAAGDAAGDAARSAAWDAAWNAAWAAADDAARAAAWNAAWAAAGDAARDAVWEALAPTVADLQSSAVDLIQRMCALRDLTDGKIGAPSRDIALTAA